MQQMAEAEDEATAAAFQQGAFTSTSSAGFSQQAGSLQGILRR